MSTCHALGLIYMVFALATLFDPNAPAYSVEAREWYLLSRICLRCAPPLYDTTLYAIQCMVRSDHLLGPPFCRSLNRTPHGLTHVDLSGAVPRDE